MNFGRTVFAQLLDHLPSYEFQKCVTRYRGDYQQKTFSCWDQYLAMAFAQLTYRDSLRDNEACLRSMQGKLYHMGFRGKVSRSTLADANESRDWRIHADFAQVLIGMARPLYAHDPNGGGSGAQSVRVGLDHHRSLPIAFSLGPVSPTQSRREDAHTARPARQYPHVYPHHRRQSARRQHPRRDRSLSRRVLCHGSRLYRFRSPLLLHTLLGIFRPAYQRECLTATALLASGRQKYRCALRSQPSS